MASSKRADAAARSSARVAAAQDVLRGQLGLLWRVHALSYIMARRPQANPNLHEGLSMPAWRVLETLIYVPDLSSNEIARLWGFDRMAVSRAVQELTGRGLVATGKDPHGGRRLPLASTPAGRELHDRVWPAAKRDYDAVGAALGAAELSNFNAAADRMLDAARSITDVED